MHESEQGRRLSPPAVRAAAPASPRPFPQPDPPPQAPSSVTSLRRSRGRFLCSRLTQPGFETGLAKSCLIARKQCVLANSRSAVARVWVSDDFAGIFECGQASPDQFIQAE